MQGAAGGGGPNELTRMGGGGGGLARFRSAPATWLDALLEDDDEDSLKLTSTHHPHHHQGLTHLLTAGTSSPVPPRSSPFTQQPASDPTFFDGGGGGSSTAAFQRMNSSPAEFLTGSVEGYFSGFGIPSTTVTTTTTTNPTSFDFVGSPSSSSSSPSRKRFRDPDSLRRGEQSGQLSGLLDLEMEKLLEDSVPCRVRAKRGCATHPRSIAERVRRTRISDRIRKLQELVPNMDKQTNTADMLDEAVEYVKTLQKQIEELTEQQKNCKCIAKS